MATLSTHVLDTSTGRPAAGVPVSLRDGAGTVLGEAVTDSDGRVGAIADDLAAGRYLLSFSTGEYFAACGVAAFHPRITVEFAVTADGHYHVPLLLSPYGYTTYRGS